MVLCGSIDLRNAGMRKKEIAEGCEVFLAVEMLQHVLAGRPAKWPERGLRLVDQCYSFHEVFERTRGIEKTVFAV